MRAAQPTMSRSDVSTLHPAQPPLGGLGAVAGGSVGLDSLLGGWVVGAAPVSGGLAVGFAVGFTVGFDVFGVSSGGSGTSGSGATFWPSFRTLYGGGFPPNALAS